MSIFKNLTVEDIAIQYQLLIDLLLQIACANGDDVRKALVKSVENRIAHAREAGMDTTILEVTLSGLTQRSDPE